MTLENETTNKFLIGVRVIEPDLESLGFAQHDFEHKGYASYVYYKRRDTVVEFIYGPSDWDVEMLITTPTRKLALKDLLQIPAIADWFANNRYKSANGRNAADELHWFVELLKFSLPIVE